MLMVCHHLHPRSQKMSPLPKAGFARRRSRRRTSSTISARSAYLIRYPGDGSCRRSDDPQLADRPQDEGTTRAAAEESGTTIIFASNATSPSTRSIRQSRTDWRTRSVRWRWKTADLVLWKPAFFGVKPEMVLIGGMIAGRQWAIQTLRSRRRSRCTIARCSAAYGRAPAMSSVTFVSQAAMVERIAGKARCGERHGGGGEYARRHLESVDGAERRHTAYGGQPGNLRGAGRRGVADLRAGNGAADGAKGIFCFEAVRMGESS